MNIYLLKQSEYLGYGTYSSCIVIAEDIESAKKTSPCLDYEWDDRSNGWVFQNWKGERVKERRHDWANSLERIEAIHLGTALPDLGPGVISSSFQEG